MPKKPSGKKKAIDLALQGGGAHGAFTWGVLDRLFQDDRIEIEAISGTSAGAMNAVVAADGMMKDDTDGARDALWKFWKAVSVAALPSPYKRTLYDMLIGNWNLDQSPGYLISDLISRVASPYKLNPLNINPMGRQETPNTAREILNRVNEITFNANLLHELRAIDFVARMLDDGSLDPKRYKKLRIHSIEAEKEFKNLNSSSKLNAEWDFMLHLHDIGKQVADDWLEHNYEAIGKRSTLDLHALLQ